MKRETMRDALHSTFGDRVAIDSVLDALKGCEPATRRSVAILG